MKIRLALMGFFGFAACGMAVPVTTMEELPAGLVEALWRQETAIQEMSYEWTKRIGGKPHKSSYQDAYKGVMYRTSETMRLGDGLVEDYL